MSDHPAAVELPASGKSRSVIRVGAAYAGRIVTVHVEDTHFRITCSRHRHHLHPATSSVPSPGGGPRSSAGLSPACRALPGLCCPGCCDQAVRSGIIFNRLRDRHEGSHPGYAPGCWLRDYKEQVFLFTRDFTVDWTNNVSEVRRQGRQAAPGRLRLLAPITTLARWCRVRSYLDSAAAHGVTALDAIRSALAGKPWLPPLPAAA